MVDGEKYVLGQQPRSETCQEFPSVVIGQVQNPIASVSILLLARTTVTTTIQLPHGPPHARLQLPWVQHFHHALTIGLISCLDQLDESRLIGKGRVLGNEGKAVSHELSRNGGVAQ